MKKCFLLSLFSFLALIGTISYSFKPAAPSSKEVVSKMLSAIAGHKGSQFTMRSYERFVGQKSLVFNEFAMKVQVSPVKIYSKVLSEKNKGTELLYAKGEREGKILVNAGKLLPNMKMSPFSSMLTKDQHHTLLSAGFSIINLLVGDAVKKAEAQGKFNEVFTLAGDATFDGKACYKVIIEDPTYTHTTHNCQKGDNIYTVALRLLVPEYSIVELNSGVKNFETDLTGKQVKVPTAYAKKTVLLIDKSTMFPLVQEVYDDKGLFEKYEYYKVTINPSFSSNEFSEDFSGYSF